MTGKSSFLNMVIAAIGLIVMVICCIKYFARQPEHVKDPTPPNAPTIWVFFLGNSYTFFHDLPHMIAAVAASDTQNPVNIQTVMAAEGNHTLDELWNETEPRTLYLSHHFDWMVLQEHSMQTLIPEWIPVMQRGMINWSNLARKSGTQPIVYETWSRKPGSDWYDPAKYPNSGMINPEQMQMQIDRVTNAVAAQIKAPVVPVGDYWAACRPLKGAPEIYAPDATHPNVVGTYLIALLFYRYLTGHSLEHVTYVASGIGTESARFLKKCASYGGK